MSSGQVALQVSPYL